MSIGKIWSYASESIVLLAGLVSFFGAFLFYKIHLDIEDAIEGICSSGDILVEVLTYEDCHEAQSVSNNYRIYAMITFLFSLYCFYDARRISAKRTNQKNIVAPETTPTFTASTSSVSTQEKYQTLEKLDSMRDKGIISEEEFQKEKDKILHS